MGIILLVVLLALVLGFTVHVLWRLLLAVLVSWLPGVALGAGEGASRGRWFRW